MLVSRQCNYAPHPPLTLIAQMSVCVRASKRNSCRRTIILMRHRCTLDSQCGSSFESFSWTRKQSFNEQNQRCLTARNHSWITLCERCCVAWFCGEAIFLDQNIIDSPIWNSGCLIFLSMATMWIIRLLLSFLLYFTLVSGEICLWEHTTHIISFFMCMKIWPFRLIRTWLYCCVFLIDFIDVDKMHL